MTRPYTVNPERKPGPKPKPADERLVQILVRLEPGQVQRVDAAIARGVAPSRSAYIRQMLERNRE